MRPNLPKKNSFKKTEEVLKTLLEQLENNCPNTGSAKLAEGFLIKNPLSFFCLRAISRVTTPRVVSQFFSIPALKGFR